MSRTIINGIITQSSNEYGKLHSIDGPTVEWNDGTKEWYQNGKLHRMDGPAVEWNDGTKEWWQNGALHRLDGPAVEYTREHFKQWWIYGKLYKTEEEWLDALSEKDKLSYLFKM